MVNQKEIKLESMGISLGIAWCLAYAPGSSNNHETLEALRQHFYHGQPCRDDLAAIVAAVRSLSDLKYPETLAELQQQISESSILWQNKIGVVYGGATKIKPYVFDVPKLHEIRGASALLDNINLVDLPAFFHADTLADTSNEERFKACYDADNENDRKIKADYCQSVRKWLIEEGYEELERSLIHELIIYSTGGNILAFCPQDLVVALADAIEKRYTTETLVANSCAVGKTYKLLELQFGLLPDQLPDDFFWLPEYQKNSHDELVQAFLKIKSDASPEEIKTAFQNRKSFNEITSQLAILFNQRRAGNDVPNRTTSRRYPVMFETHPYLRRDNAEKRSAVLRAEDLPNSPSHSEPSARKRIMGQITKRDDASQHWYQNSGLKWKPNHKAESWVKRFEDYLEAHPTSPYYTTNLEDYFQRNPNVAKAYRGSSTKVWEAQTVGLIGNASQPAKFIGYIYADGNNMGGYIQGIKTPEKYREFSEDISEITENSVYEALAQHLTIHYVQGLTDPDESRMNNQWVHPFEIITIGGDDVFLIVPADKALQIAQAIGAVFERELAKKPEYHISSKPQSQLIHRYQPTAANPSKSCLSMSIGVLITAEDTPILYAENLTNQLLKSAKETAKKLKKQGYYGGTIDFLVLKSVTMISSDVKEFRQNGLVKTFGDKKTLTGETPKDLHLYAAPYTLHEIEGLIKLIQALKAVNFPKSQLYQIRSFLEKGKRTAILNYRYFRIRLKEILQKPLQEDFEDHWCNAKTNPGNTAPWMYVPNDKKPQRSHYETVWREMVDLYEFIPELPDTSSNKQAAMMQSAGGES
jgi:CRISPR-associated protein Cmr2